MQKLELDIRKSHPRLSKEIFNADWEHDVNNEKLKAGLLWIQAMLEDEGGLDALFQDEGFKKLIKSIPKELKNESK